MSYLGTFKPQPNAATFSGYVEALDDDTGTAFDLSTALIEVEVTDQRGGRRLYGSTTDGTVVLVADGFEFTFPASAMRQLCAGSYTVNILVTDTVTGFVEEPSIADLPVIEGGFRG